MRTLVIARDTLDQIDAVEDEEFRAELFALKASILAEIGDQEQFLSTYVAKPDAIQLRNMAKALAAREDWANSIQFYKQLQTKFLRLHPSGRLYFKRSDATSGNPILSNMLMVSSGSSTDFLIDFPDILSNRVTKSMFLNGAYSSLEFR